MTECKIGDEEARLAALRRYEILDTEPEEAFDRITRLAMTVLQTPMVLVSLVDQDRQWFKSRQGVTMCETARAISFCTHTIRDDQPLIVADTHADPRFAGSPLVVGTPFIRFYVGVPLRTRDGHNIGALCSMDTQVRHLSPEQIRMLEDLARLVVDEMELRLLAATDSLTGALSRQTFCDSAARDHARSRRSGAHLSCALIDFDHFKRINDSYGHGTGDLVLQRAIAACRAELRGSDYIGRIGGEEFAVIFPDTPLMAAADVAERLRNAIEAITIKVAGERIQVSASIGVVERGANDQRIETLLKAADSAMYRAKSGGRNRTVCGSDGFCDLSAWGVVLDADRADARPEMAARPASVVDIYDDLPESEQPVHLDFLEGARKCFRHAKDGTNSNMKALFAEIGLDYLRLAHQDASLVTTHTFAKAKI